MGRWINRDLIEERGGVNLYAYVRNDPVNRIDPSGTDAGGAVIGGGTGAVVGGLIGAGLGCIGGSPVPVVGPPTGGIVGWQQGAAIGGAWGTVWGYNNINTGWGNAMSFWPPGSTWGGDEQTGPRNNCAPDPCEPARAQFLSWKQCYDWCDTHCPGLKNMSCKIHCAIGGPPLGGPGMAK
jgi:uncharacterized protein RhaS with RHS repeats